jgi:single-strand DNA-binding protein
MSKSVNKVILIGNVGQDPDIRYTAGGKAVAKLSLATNERYRNRSGEWEERTEWHSVVAWQRLAEIIGEYVGRGSRVYIEGRLQTSSWEDRQSGETKYRTEIVAREIVLLGSKQGDNEEHLRSGGDAEPEPAYASSEMDDLEIPF